MIGSLPALDTILAGPRVNLSVDGRPIDADIAMSLTAITIEMTEGRPSQLVATFMGHDVSGVAGWADRSLSVGVAGDTIFTGTIAATERRWSAQRVHTVHVRALDALDELRRVRRNVAFEGRSVSDVIDEVVAGHGLSLQCRFATPTVDAIHQFGESDLALVRRLAGAAGLHVTLRGSTIHLYREGGIAERVELELFRDLLDVAIERRPVDRPPTTRCGWDPVAMVPIGPASESIDAGTSVDNGWLMPIGLVEAAAEAERRAGIESRTVITGSAMGDVRLRPGTVVRIAGPHGSEGADGLITSATHHVDADRGWTTTFTTAEPAPAPSVTDQHGAFVTVGTVTAIDDPDGRGRVRVNLANSGGLGGTWMPVVLPAVSSRAGIVALPDIDDTVVVVGASPHHERGFVLGGVAVEGLPTEPVVGTRSRRFSVAMASGGRLTIDDDDVSVQLDDGNGNRLDMRADAVTLHTTTDLTLSAPGHRVRVVADRIDFERG